jgi:hypothetical protein
MTPLPTRRFGLDSTGPVPVSAHHAVGSSVALRYLSRSTAKVVTRSEHEHYQAAGIALVLVFEDSGRPDRSDYAGGKADAEFAVKQATDILGAPPRPPCLRFAADYDPAGHPEAADAYFDGVRAVIHTAHCGPYGSDQMVAHQHGRGFGTLWQTYAWSGGRFFSSPANSVYQYANGHTVGGVGVDYNHIYGDDFGQWDYKPTPSVALDPHQYHRFNTHVRAIVVEYDKLRAHPFLHRPRLKVLRALLAQLALDVYHEAHGNPLWSSPVWGRPGLPNWTAHHAGWRYQQLIHRAQGQLVAA